MSVDSIESVRDSMWVGEDPSDVLDWFATLPESRTLGCLTSSQRQRFLDELVTELEHRTRPDGVYLTGTAWLVEAHTPAHPGDPS
jgi:hypothetical protein